MRDRLNLLVDAREAGPALAAAITTAQRSIDLQMLTFEGDRVGRYFADLLIQRAQEGVQVRVLIDYFTRMVLSDVMVIPGWVFSGDVRREYRETRRMMEGLRSGGAAVRMTNRPGRDLRRILWRNHKKMVIVDKRVAFLGGTNLSEHNFAWHDLMVRLEGNLASRLGRDFERTWNGRMDLCPPRTAGESRFLGNTSQIRDAVSVLIERAEREVILESPYTGGWIMKRLADAARRGVRVSVIVPARNNFPFFSYLHSWYGARYSRTGLSLYRYDGHEGMTHLKALLADDTAVVGSSNFSMHFLEESALITRDRKFVAELMERVFERDIGISRK